MAIPTRTNADIEGLRRSFIEREERATYEELSKEFNVPLGTIKGYAADESWITLRLHHQEAQAQKSDALSIVLRATKVDQRVISAFTDVVVASLQKITRTVQDVDDTRAPSTRAQTLNTCSFAAKNLGDLCKAVGIVGVAAKLDREGREDNGKWNPQVLNQINVVVEDLKSKAQRAETPKPTEPSVELPQDPASEAPKT
jgi:hypothetical protein